MPPGGKFGICTCWLRAVLYISCEKHRADHVHPQLDVLRGASSCRVPADTVIGTYLIPTHFYARSDAKLAYRQSIRTVLTFHEISTISGDRAAYSNNVREKRMKHLGGSA